MDPQAQSLNNIISHQNPNVYSMLSEKGKNIFFPKLGILAQSAQAKGKKINATIGEAVEDDGTSMHLPEFDSLVSLPPNKVFTYAPSFGNPELREKWKEMIYRKNLSLNNIPISKPIVTNGLTHGASMIGYMFADSQDTVVLSDLYWENYNLIFGNGYGASIKLFQLFKNNAMNTGALAKTLKEINQEKILLLLNFPNNPSGYTPLVQEVDAIVDVIRNIAESGKKIVAIIDDAYFGLVYEKNVFTESIFTRLFQLHENVLAVKLDGPTKEDYVWGFRVGFITYGIKNGTPELYEALENKTAGAIRGNISNCSHLSQSLLLNVYNHKSYDDSRHKKYEILKTRFVALKDIFSDKKYEKYFKPLPFNSGYFMCVELNEKLNAEEVRQKLLKDYDTGVIVFGNLIRLAFSAVAQSNIHNMIENLYSACKEIYQK